MISLSTIGAWLASYGFGYLVKLIVDAGSAWLSQRQADANAKQVGASDVVAKTNEATVEVQDEMDNVPRPTDDDVASRLQSGKF